MRRGETEGFLYFRLTPPESEALGTLYGLFVRGNSKASEQVKLACDDCLKRLLGFAMEVEARGFYKKKAATLSALLASSTCTTSPSR